MKTVTLTRWWNAYKNYVKSVVLASEDAGDIGYRRNDLFCNILIHLAPASLIALIPSVYMSFTTGLLVLGIYDLFAFFLVIAIMVWDWDIENNHLTWDDGMFQLYKIDNIEFGSVYDGWIGRLHPEDRDRTNDEIQAAVNGQKAYNTQFRIVMNDQSIRHIRASGKIEKDEAGNAHRMIGANWDVTEKKMQQEKLSASQANLTAIIENTDANIYSLDCDFRYITFNQNLKNSVKQNFGIDVKAGDIVFDFLESFAPEEANDWKRIYIEALTGKALKFEKEFNVGGIITTTSFSVNPIIEKSIVIGLSCFAVDVTDIKMARQEILLLNEGLELKVKERTAELENANRELEAFSYSVSHDLRSPVRAIMGFTRIITKEYKESLTEAVKEMFAYIQASSKRMNTIIDDLFTLAKYGKEKLNFAEVDLNVLFNNVWDDMLFTNPHQAILHMMQMPLVRGDISMLQQVVVNLLSNAVKYSSKKDSPQIEVGYIMTNKMVTIYVKDNGAGFDMKQYDRLFGAFQRLHGISEFEGTGVGLMLIKKIINRHGGEVWAEGKIGEGAQFYFSLPIAVNSSS